MPIFILFASCSSEKPGELTDSETVVLRDTTVSARDGQDIACTLGGQGSLTLLFVHGWCIDKSYWHQQQLNFGRNTRTVAIDLPGFGESGKKRADYSIAGYARDIQAVIKQLDLSNVILVGHSMSGDIVLEAALAMPEVLAIVGIDNFKDIDMELNEEMQVEIDRFMQMLEEKYTEIAPAYAEQSLFHQSTDPTIREKVLEAIRSTDPQIAISCLQAVFDYGKIEKERLAKLQQKLYLINTDNPKTNQKALKELKIDFDLYAISNSGHYPMIEQPAEFNKALEHILSDIRGVLAIN